MYVFKTSKYFLKLELNCGKIGVVLSENKKNILLISSNGHTGKWILPAGTLELGKTIATLMKVNECSADTRQICWNRWIFQLFSLSFCGLILCLSRRGPWRRCCARDSRRSWRGRRGPGEDWRLCGRQEEPHSLLRSAGKCSYSLIIPSKFASTSQSANCVQH